MPILAITLYPYILLTGKQRAMSDWNDPYNQFVVINHEEIHIAQYQECWVVGFFVLYLWDYLVGRVKYKYNHQKAYRQIRFEQEAYTFQMSSAYLSVRTRKRWHDYEVGRS